MTRDDVITLLKHFENQVIEVKPHVIMGDDDSIYLTEYQEGYRAGMEAAVKAVQATLKTDLENSND